MANVTFIGLGVMGFPMAGHLAKAGHKVAVWNRTSAKAERWASLHAGRIATAPADAARGAEFVFTCVGNDDDLRAVTTGPSGIFEGLAPGAVHVDHSTTSAEVARELAGIARGHGFHFLDAPVSGGQAGAENGRLTCMVGGDAAAFERAAPLMSAYAATCRRLGDSGAGQLTKMVNQICIAGLLQGLAEGVAFGARAGLDRQGRGAVLADGESRHHDGGRQVRLRFCRRLDAKGSRHRAGRGTP